QIAREQVEIGIAARKLWPARAGHSDAVSGLGTGRPTRAGSIVAVQYELNIQRSTRAIETPQTIGTRRRAWSFRPFRTAAPDRRQDRRGAGRRHEQLEVRTGHGVREIMQIFGKEANTKQMRTQAFGLPHR